MRLNVLNKFVVKYKLNAVIHLEIGSSESRDSHSQKLASPSDKRVSPIQHFSSFSVRNALLRSWYIHSFVTRQFHQNSFQALWSKSWRLKICHKRTGVFLSLFQGKTFSK